MTGLEPGIRIHSSGPPSRPILAVTSAKVCSVSLSEMTQRMQELRASSGVEPNGNLTVHSFADERDTGTVALLLAAPSTYMVRVYADMCSGGREIRWGARTGAPSRAAGARHDGAGGGQCPDRQLLT